MPYEVKYIKINSKDLDGKTLDIDSIVSSNVLIFSEPTSEINEFEIDSNLDQIQYSTNGAGYHQINFGSLKDFEKYNNIVTNYDNFKMGNSSISSSATYYGVINFNTNESEGIEDPNNFIFDSTGQKILGINFGKVPNIGISFELKFDIIRDTNDGEVKFWLTNDPYNIAQFNSYPKWNMNYTGSYNSFPFSSSGAGGPFHNTAMGITFNNVSQAYTISSSFAPYLICQDSSWGIIFSASAAFTMSAVTCSIIPFEDARYNLIALSGNLNPYDPNTNDENYLIFQPPVSENDPEFISEFYNSDNNPLINNINRNIKNTHFYNVEYDSLTGMTFPSNFDAIINQNEENLANIPNSFFTQLSNINARYNGVTVSAQEYNVYNNGDDSFGKTSTVDIYPGSIAYFKFAKRRNEGVVPTGSKTVYIFNIEKIIEIPNDPDLKSNTEYSPLVYNMNSGDFTQDLYKLFPSQSQVNLNFEDLSKFDEDEIWKYSGNRTVTNQIFSGSSYTTSSLNSVVVLMGNPTGTEVVSNITSSGYIVPTRMSSDQIKNIPYVLNKLGLDF